MWFSFFCHLEWFLHSHSTQKAFYDYCTKRILEFSRMARTSVHKIIGSVKILVLWRLSNSIFGEYQVLKN